MQSTNELLMKVCWLATKMAATVDVTAIAVLQRYAYELSVFYQTYVIGGHEASTHTLIFFRYNARIASI